MAARNSFWDRPLGQIVMAVGPLGWAAFLIVAAIAVFLSLNYLILDIPLSTR